MKNAANGIATASPAAPGVERYVSEIDGSQIAFWTCTQSAASAAPRPEPSGVLTFRLSAHGRFRSAGRDFPTIQQSTVSRTFFQPVMRTMGAI